MELISPEQLKNCKEVPLELIDMIIKQIKETCSDYDDYNNLEDFMVKYQNQCYTAIEIEESKWDDQGKYQYQDIIYQLVAFDDTSHNITERFNLFISLSVSRTGSYYSDYYYTYLMPTLMLAKINHVPEQVIPAHDEVHFEEINNKME